MTDRRPDGDGPPASPGKFRASIATVLSLVFGVLLLLAGGTILRVGVQTGLDSVSALTADKVVLILDTVTNRLRDHLMPAQRITETLARMVAAGSLDLKNPLELATALESSLSATPQVRSIIFVDTRGIATSFHASKRDLGVEVDDWSGQEGLSEALTSLRHSRETIWGRPVHVAEPDVTVLNVRAPAFRGDEFLGVFIAAVGVDELSRHLGAVMASAGEVPFVLSGPDRVIAHPTLEANRSQRSTDEPLLPLLAVDDPVLIRIWDEAVRRPARRVPLPPGYEAIVVSVPLGDEEKDYVIVFQHVYGLGEIPWTVGVHFPVEAIGEQLIRLVRAGVGGLVLLAFGILATVLIARAIARPVRRLSVAAHQLEAAGPHSVETLPSSRFSEIDAANYAFNQMVLGMRERELIRDLFGRFVPEEIARILVADRGALEPQTRVATVFFSDIAGFGTLAEGMKPEALVQLLNEYFELLGEILSRYHGVVQQFQGDAILATFNMPVPDPDHAANAVRAAVDIQRALDGRTFGDGLALPTRIGINTGTMVGGTVGSESRKSYTVHGDHVNVAARIEQLNKQYGTSVLVAESTVEEAGGVFRFEPIGKVPIRGRNQTARLFRVLDLA